MADQKTIHQKNLECLTKEIYKFLYGLFSPVINDIFEVRGNIYNLINFQSLYSVCIKTVRSGTEMVTYRSPQIWNLFSDDIENVSFLENFKREIKKWKDEKFPSGICKINLKNIGFI